VAADRSRLQNTLGYRFSDESLLEQALTHRSCGSGNNERLEFLGDSIINHIIAESLYRRFEGASEGELSRMRAALVRGDTLAELAREFELGDYIRLGPGEMKSGGRRRNSILADALEAVAGAILLDAGQQAVHERVLAWFHDRLEQVSPKHASRDAKTRLQEYLQGRGMSLPEYNLVEISGENHRQEFTVQCEIVEKAIKLEGVGSSRRKAEQAAADAALEALGER